MRGRGTQSISARHTRLPASTARDPAPAAGLKHAGEELQQWQMEDALLSHQVSCLPRYRKPSTGCREGSHPTGRCPINSPAGSKHPEAPMGTRNCRTHSRCKDEGKTHRKPEL